MNTPTPHDVHRALVVVPTYNERENITRAVTRALKADDRVEVLVVDDGSPDGTAGIVGLMARDDERVHLMRREGKGGLGSAYRAGFAWALERDYDAVVEMDADLSHPADRLPALLDGLSEADVVIGSRWVPGGATSGWPVSRQLLSRGGNLYVRLMLGLGVGDSTAGFRAFRREALETIDAVNLGSEGYCFQVESTYVARRLGLRLAEVPITFTEREEGTSKMSNSIVLEALLRVTGWAFGISRPAAARSAVVASTPGAKPALSPAARTAVGVAVVALVGGIAAAANADTSQPEGSAAGTGASAPVAVPSTSASTETGDPAPSATTPADRGPAARDAGGADVAVPVPATAAQNAPGDVPVSIRIPSIGVTSTLVDLGIASDGTMQVPTDYAKAGWLTAAPAPGTRGPAVIAGHVDDQDGPAVFYRLRDLEPGAQIEVTQTDGDVVAFTVRSVEDFKKDAFPTAKVYGPAPGPVLRLITCGGEFDRSTGHYEDNTVVFAS